MHIETNDITYTTFLENIDTHFNKSSYSIHKARNEIKILNFMNEELVVKSFKIPTIINKLIYTFFRDSKAKKSYIHSLKIPDFAPQTIAYIELEKNGLLDRSYFISKNFKYDFTIREPLLDFNFHDRENIFKAFAQFTYKLHQNNVYHLDYSPGNILIKIENGKYIFNIVDINRMKFFNLSQTDRAKNFSKLWADESILTTIATEYTKLYSCDETFIKQVIYFSNQNKKIKNFKKRLKNYIGNSHE